MSKQSDSNANADIQCYIKCMEEIKRRTHVVDLILDKKINTGFAITNAELLAVQLRKIAELISLSSICAHREEYQKLRAEFDQDWNFSRILKTIEKINPRHYPFPTKQILDSKTQKVIRVEAIESGYLTKSRMIEMGGSCAEILHAFNPYQKSLPNLEEFTSRCKIWIAETYVLLGHHQIQLVDQKNQWWVIMHAKNDGKVHVAEMEAVN